MKDSGREPGRKDSGKPGKAGKNDRSKRDRKPVSYTHLTLPTIYSV